MSTQESDSPRRTGEEADAERRGLLRRLAGIGAGVFVGGWVLGSLRAVGQRGGASYIKRDTGVSLASLRGPRAVDGVILVPLGGKRVRALDRRCTHLGCPVSPGSEGRRLVCPCHGSVYDLAGHRLQGPARRSLRRLRATVDAAGRIWVHGPV